MVPLIYRTSRNMEPLYRFHHGRRRKIRRKAVALNRRPGLVRTGYRESLLRRPRKTLRQLIGVDGRCCQHKRKSDCRLAFTRSACDRIHRYLEAFSPIQSRRASRLPRRSNERGEPECLVMTDCPTRIPSRRTHYLSPRLGSYRQ